MRKQSRTSPRAGISPRRVATAFAAVAMVLAWFAGVAGENATRAAAASSPVSVFPIPGAHTAAPQTQITFRGVPATALGPITVTGSRSGVHSGHVQADSDGNGGSFLPDRPFTAGETVTVSTGLSVVNANGATTGGSGGSGAGGGTPGGTFTFTVARPANGLPSLHWPPQGRTRGDVQFFHSRHDLSPVTITVQRHGATGDGDIFIAPQWGPVQDGPMILDPNGNLIWFDKRSGNTSAADFRVQTYHGQPVLTWWQGTLAAGVGIGQDVIFDNTYKQVATVSAGNGLRADLHAFQLTPQGTALIVADYPVYYDARSVHGNKRQIVLDSVVQEIDVPTGLVLFQWDALDHVPLKYSYQTLPSSLGSPYDPYHLNSVDLDRDGSLLISSRETWAAYKVNHQTGAIVWTLGGKHSNFRIQRGAGFAFQHDVRVRSNGDQFLTVFDDEGGPPTLHNSRGLELKLDFKHWTASASYVNNHSPALASNYEGNVQQLSNFNHVIGWGQQPYVSEYNTRGQTIFDARMAGDDATFSAYRFNWNAVPWTLPAIAASTSGHTTSAFVSWNGATTVASWRLLGGASPTTLTPIATAPKTSFETAFHVPAQGYVAVQALDSTGQVIKASDPIAPR